MNGSQDQASFYQLLGANIQKSRRKLGISQDELARLVGLTRTSLTNIERGRQHPPIYTFCEIAERLNVDPSALLPRRASRSSVVDVEAIVGGQVRGVSELKFIATAIGVKSGGISHANTTKKN
jgi:transcriptional regulator with XRE-family HTH domain